MKSGTDHVLRLEGAEKVTGRARYAGDQRLPGVLYARIVRSSLPHARVLRQVPERGPPQPKEFRMSSLQTLDAAGRPRSPATLPGYLSGRQPRNKGLRYPADPPRVEEIIAVMRKAGPSVHGARIRGLIVVLWRAGLRVGEALALAERDLDPDRGAIIIRAGKGGKRREVGMDDWEQLRPWLEERTRMPVGPLFCIVNGPTSGRPWSAPAVRSQLRELAIEAGVRRRANDDH